MIYLLVMLGVVLFFIHLLCLCRKISIRAFAISFAFLTACLVLLVILIETDNYKNDTKNLCRQANELTK